MPKKVRKLKSSTAITPPEQVGKARLKANRTSHIMMAENVPDHGKFPNMHQRMRAGKKKG